MKNKKRSVKKSFYNTFKTFKNMLPLIMGIILLLGLFKVFISKEMLLSLFKGRLLHDTLIGSSFGSIATGSPITSYIIGGELLRDKVSLLAVTAFIVSWVTVGLVQLPAEIGMLGKRFALARNILSFTLSILVAMATVITLALFK
jgi:uncharacterized membrane protein YraQ (UPF0718 family)